MSIFIAKREDGRAQHGNARPHTSHLIPLVVWNQRVQNSQIYPQQTHELRFQMSILSTWAKQSRAIMFLKLLSLTFPSPLTTRTCLYHYLPLITLVFAKGAGMFRIRHSFVSSFCPPPLPPSPCLFPTVLLSPPSLCLSISFSLLNSLSVLVQALVIAGSLLNSHNALL